MIGEFRLKVFVGFFTACMIGVATCFLPTGLRQVVYPTAYAVTTFTVNTADDHDDGNCNVADCTLREAINAANANPDSDIINFNIPGSGLHTINATEGFFISRPVTIDGSTQPGFAGVPLIELNGAGAGVMSIGLNIVANNTSVRSLIVNRFAGYGITFDSFGSNTVQGCYIGTDATGTTAQPNGVGGIRINVANITIGGTSAADRNVISGNTGNGIDVISAGTTIQANFIGTNVSGTAAVPNTGNGIKVDNTNNCTIGGTAAGAGNVISGNAGNGIDISGAGATGNTVQGNFIGTDINGSAKVPNSIGISIGNGAHDNQIGGSSTGQRNVISGNEDRKSVV